jgi:hypothetical protein
VSRPHTYGGRPSIEPALPTAWSLVPLSTGYPIVDDGTFHICMSIDRSLVSDDGHDMLVVTGCPQLDSLVHSIGVFYLRHKPGLKQANQGGTVSAMTSRLAILSNPPQSFAGCSTRQDAHVTDVRQMHASTPTREFSRHGMTPGKPKRSCHRSAEWFVRSRKPPNIWEQRTAEALARSILSHIETRPRFHPVQATYILSRRT